MISITVRNPFEGLGFNGFNILDRGLAMLPAETILSVNDRKLESAKVVSPDDSGVPNRFVVRAREIEMIR